ncbi:transposase [Polaribacter litorisediminis]|uniref:transposase n=1 Tax=Polaribacter litorisediminis TaxID=1908341 RepID=UPI001CBC7A2D|nr:transposase [Polaribacter litorisediminis]
MKHRWKIIHLRTTHKRKTREMEKKEKTIKSGLGTFEIQIPTDRNNSFEPEIIKKSKRY